MKSDLQLYEALARLYRAVLPALGPDVIMYKRDRDELRDACTQAEQVMFTSDAPLTRAALRERAHQRPEDKA